MEIGSGTVAFITGGASGLGLGMAKAFLERGANVAVADIMADHLDAARAELEGLGSCHFIRLDVTDRAGFAAAADEAERVLGPVSILCNNAGVGALGAFPDSDYRDWDWVMGVNFGGALNGVQTFLPRMLTRGDGHIVNTASIGAVLLGPGGAAYLTAKAAVLGLSETLYCDVHDKGIGVTAILLGPTASNIHKVSKQRPAAFAGTAQAAREVASGDAPLLMAGMEPIEAGRKVIDAIEADQLYLFTHREFRHGVQQRLDAIMAGFGPDDGGPPAVTCYGFPTFSPPFGEIVARSRKSDN